MLTREMPNTKDALSILGFGCMRFPGKQGNPDEAEAIRQIHHAIDRGINYFDTAWPYHGGKSEVILGKALKNGLREKVKVADKLPQWLCNSRDDMDWYLAEQLKRLDTDRIDYYLIHAVNRSAWERAVENGVIDFLNSAKESGKIGAASFSFHGPHVDFNPIIDAYNWDFCQIQFNILDEHYQAGRAGLDYAHSKGIGVIIMEPLRGGSLARTLPSSIESIYRDTIADRTNADWALRWVWNHEGVISVLSGMNSIEQIDENAVIASTAEVNSMTDRELSAVRQTADTFRSLMKVPCTACQYCMPCPAGVDIPSCISFYNAKYLLNAGFMNRAIYLLQNQGTPTKKPAFASACVNCGKWIDHCPQHIAIPTELKRVEKEFEGILKKPLLWLGNAAMSRGKRK